jgi:hypothetical protein
MDEWARDIGLSSALGGMGGAMTRCLLSRANLSEATGKAADWLGGLTGTYAGGMGAFGNGLIEVLNGVPTRSRSLP